MSTKRNLSTLLNFLFPLVFYRSIFNLERQNFSLKKPPHDERAPAILLTDDIYYGVKFARLLPHPLCGCPFDFCVGGEYGCFSLGKNVFFPTPLELEFFA